MIVAVIDNLLKDSIESHNFCNFIQKLKLP